ncbi:MAG: hypothetical protein ABIR32_14350 [Ilumatobacteraceae bacterium]
MNAPRRNGNQGQRRQQQRSNQPANVLKPVDLWRPVPQLPDVEPIVVTHDPAMLFRSLGDPPLMGKSTVAGHYIATVIERAAGLASALAASADLLEQPPTD